MSEQAQKVENKNIPEWAQGLYYSSGLMSEVLVAGAVTGDEDKKAEGQAQQRMGAAGEEAAQKAKTRQTEKEAREAERERDRQRRKDEGGLLGNL
jgi:uncharacterized protein YjbJ (UPF0337 family)